ncbi:glucose-6-phosphate dehydrogenase assembly protein OpcA [Dictyobacter formicarum]|nr:glucose-6-phosphate dehydrogenase assembly protein OpcA [Dictyobacter formicarum]
MAMDNSATPRIHLPWAGKKVNQEQVEGELSTLWHLAADNMRISQNMNVRTSVLNFVICAQDIESARKASAILRDLSSTHIARVTLLILDTRSDAPSEVSTWITLRSFPIISDIMRHHFEQITISVGGSAIRFVDNIVQSTLKPDLPVYLWWLNDLPEDHEIFHRLINISNRVIIDSSHFLQPEEQIQDASAILQKSPHCALSDLTWGRVTAWRELIAQFFDITEYRPYVMGVDSILIEHTVATSTQALDHHSNPKNPIRALLLAAWLKNRLGWQLSDDPSDNDIDHETGTYSWHMSTRDMTKVVTQPLSVSAGGRRMSAPLGGIRISIQPRALGKSAPGTLCLVHMTSTVHGKQATFTIQRGDDDDHVLTSVELPGSVRPPRTVNIAATHKESDLLHNELEIMGRDRLYEMTLHEVFALLA